MLTTHHPGSTTARATVPALARILIAAGALLVAWTSFAHAQARIAPEPRYAGVAAALTRFITDQMAEKRLPALSIAVVDGQRIVWARGFGDAGSK